MLRKCDHCSNEYTARKADVKRGWGLCCTKSCAAKKREESKPSYNIDTVRRNNIRRANWNSPDNPRSDSFRPTLSDEEYYNKETHPFSSEGLGQE